MTVQKLLETVKSYDEVTNEIFYEIDLLSRDELVTTLVEIQPIDSDTFLKVKESMTRVGFGNRSKKELHQICHILHKKGRYFVVHYREMQAMDAMETEMSPDDYLRRNHIAKLLQTWNLIKIINNDIMLAVVEDTPISVYVLPFKEKSEWKLKQKYVMGTIKEYTNNGNK